MANTESTDDGTERSQNAPRKVIRIAAADGRIHEREAVRLFTIAADCHRRGDLKGAVGGYPQALLLNPSFPDPYNNLGVALRAMGRYEAAVACYRRSLGIRPGNAGLYSNLGNALRDLDRYVEAAAPHKMAVELAPDMPDAIYNLGLVLRDLGQMNDALAWFERALKRNPDHVECRWDRALTLLQMEDFEKGFPEYEWRWRLSATPKRTFDQPRWDGSDLAGRTILLHQEQGLGDMIQFIRYAPLVKALGGTVLVECQPELARLFSTARGVDKIVIKDNRLPPFDVYAPLLSLPGILGTTLETVPAKVPYLAGPELHNLHLPIPVGSRLNVGIVWAGKVTHANDRRRSCPVEHLIGLTGLPGVTFYSLQKGAAAGDLARHACEALVMDMGDKLQDFADTAVVLSQLDLVIAVDTAVVHLAGALGRPTWVLLPVTGDWRWLDGRGDNPWYPTVRPFRQESAGDWAGVMTRVQAALQEELGKKPPATA